MQKREWHGAGYAGRPRELPPCRAVLHVRIRRNSQSSGIFLALGVRAPSSKTGARGFLEASLARSLGARERVIFYSRYGIRAGNPSVECTHHWKTPWRRIPLVAVAYNGESWSRRMNPRRISRRYESVVIENRNNRRRGAREMERTDLTKDLISEWNFSFTSII